MAVPGSIVGVGKLITPGGQQGPKGDAGSTAALADITQNGLLRQTPGTTTSFVDGTNNYQNLITAIDPEIWSVRLRSFNSVHNCDFGVDQRTAGVGVVVPTGSINSFALDRWLISKVGTMACSGQQVAANVVIPGTNFLITRSIFRVLLATQQASLGASDYCVLQQVVEGPNFRELQNDHSFSVLVRSTVAGLKFGVCLRDTPATKSLTKLCTISSANTWQTITLPALPVWPSGNFVNTPGSVGYVIDITLAAGATLTAAANDTFQNGSFYGALGQDNYFSKPVSSSFDLAMIQHEPGAVSTFQDKQFIQSLDECSRYYLKSYDLATAVGAVGVGNGTVSLMSISGGAVGPVRFAKRMAKVPTMASYSHVTGTINTLRDVTGAAERTVTAFTQVGETGFDGITATSVVAATGGYCRAHYTADTGW